MEYPKIDTLFERDKATFVVNPEQLKSPVLATINQWIVTEKIDGTNIRVILSQDGIVSVKGRTDNAQLSPDLIMYLLTTFTPALMQDVFWTRGPCEICLYGEGYGAGIQKGGSYNARKSFRLFDILIGPIYWLDWDLCVDFAFKLGIKTVPYLGHWSLDEITAKVRDGLPSVVAREETGLSFLSEGIVARPIEPLFNKRGERVIIKLKTKDFKSGKR